LLNKFDENRPDAVLKMPGKAPALPGISALPQDDFVKFIRQRTSDSGH
jgi:hypothetical protein